MLQSAQEEDAQRHISMPLRESWAAQATHIHTAHGPHGHGRAGKARTRYRPAAIDMLFIILLRLHI